MSAQIIDGDAIAAKITDDLKAEIEDLKAKGKAPHLHAVQANPSMLPPLRKEPPQVEYSALEPVNKQSNIPPMGPEICGKALHGFHFPPLPYQSHLLSG